MNEDTFKALKNIMFRTIWKNTNAKISDVYKIMDWIDKVAKKYKE